MACSRKSKEARGEVAGWPSARTLLIGAEMTRRLFVLALLAATSACSPSPGISEIRVDSPWARPTLAAGRTSAAYLSIENRGAGDDRLVGASSEVAGRMTLHAASNENGIARMRPLPAGLAIGGGETVKLEPGGYHLMIEQLKRPLTAGETIPITLNFERSGPRRIEAQVGDGPADDSHARHEAH